jgi:hypothetical protein
MYTAAEGRELVQILLAAGADPTAQDAQHGRTALHTAAMANNVELVRVRCFPTKNVLPLMFKREGYYYVLSVLIDMLLCSTIHLKSKGSMPSLSKN